MSAMKFEPFSVLTLKKTYKVKIKKSTVLFVKGPRNKSYSTVL